MNPRTAEGRLLSARLRAEFSEISLKLIEFPSGAFMIDLNIRGEIYVIEQIGGQGYGLSRQKDATFGWEGVDHQFDDIDTLCLCIRQLLE